VPKPRLAQSGEKLELGVEGYSGFFVLEAVPCADLDDADLRASEARQGEGSERARTGDGANQRWARHDTGDGLAEGREGERDKSHSLKEVSLRLR